jgi:hypothetical protein
VNECVLPVKIGKMVSNSCPGRVHGAQCTLQLNLGVTNLKGPMVCFLEQGSFIMKSITAETLLLKSLLFLGGTV